MSDISFDSTSVPGFQPGRLRSWNQAHWTSHKGRPEGRLKIETLVCPWTSIYMGLSENGVFPNCSHSTSFNGENEWTLLWSNINKNWGDPIFRPQIYISMDVHAGDDPPRVQDSVLACFSYCQEPGWSQRGLDPPQTNPTWLPKSETPSHMFHWIALRTIF